MWFDKDKLFLFISELYLLSSHGYGFVRIYIVVTSLFLSRFKTQYNAILSLGTENNNNFIFVNTNLKNEWLLTFNFINLYSCFSIIVIHGDVEHLRMLIKFFNKIVLWQRTKQQINILKCHLISATVSDWLFFCGIFANLTSN